MVLKFIEGIEKLFVKKEFEISFKSIFVDFFKGKKFLILSYGYLINFSIFVYELIKRSIVEVLKGFDFDRIFIEENVIFILLYFFNF